MANQKRNEKCNCGSGLKYKKCCIKSDYPTNPKEIHVMEASSLQECLHNAESKGVNSLVWEGVMYVKLNGKWIKNDIAPHLLQIPSYKKAYQFALKQSKGDKHLAYNIVLTLMTTSYGIGNEYDLSQLIK